MQNSTAGVFSSFWRPKYICVIFLTETQRVVCFHGNSRDQNEKLRDVLPWLGEEKRRVWVFIYMLNTNVCLWRGGELWKAGLKLFQAQRQTFCKIFIYNVMKKNIKIKEGPHFLLLLLITLAKFCWQKMSFVYCQ